VALSLRLGRAWTACPIGLKVALAVALFFALLPIGLSVYARWWDLWLGQHAFVTFWMPRA